MKKIDRWEEPEFWAQYKKMHPRQRYSDLKMTEDGNQVRRNLREYLLQSQHGLCCYCCRKIGMEDSLNEHIRPQNAYPKQTMEYANLIASCKTEGINATCGSKKDKEYDEDLFVSPLSEECEKYFEFYPNGQVSGVGTSGEYTCKLLNLDAYELQRARRAQYKICDSYQDPEMVYLLFLTPDQDGVLEPFADMIQYFYDRGDFHVHE